MPFDSTIADIRFGMGLSPTIAPPASLEELLAQLDRPDVMAQAVEIPKYPDAYPLPKDLQDVGRAFNAALGTDGEEAARVARQDTIAAADAALWRFMAATVARAAHTPDGFRERLVHFWADHFTARATHGNSSHLISAYIEEAIRPNTTTTFGDMLVAVVGSEMMLVSLDQNKSIGPNSEFAQGRDGRGLNENLAREVLELHTLGAGGIFDQTDVRQFAELLTGLTVNNAQGAVFRPELAEPGPETVLGVTYGGDEEKLEYVNAALRDLAIHPDTARHLSRKLAVHFLSPEPDQILVEAMTARYLETSGDLRAVYEVMLRSQAAWTPQFEKVKQPFDFVASSYRALGVPLDEIVNSNRHAMRNNVQQPMTVMGQSWQRPVGPDGWPEDAQHWITPQGMAGRITWAMQVPQNLLDKLPDPREFVFTALGPTPPEAVLFAANAAETVSDGVGLVLASAAFQRR